MANHPVHVLDNYYLAITLLVTIGYQLVGFAIAYSLKFDSVSLLLLLTAPPLS